jgi:hypothetical protein
VDPKPSPWKYAQSGGDGTIVIVSEFWTLQTVYPPIYTPDSGFWVTPTTGIRSTPTGDAHCKGHGVIRQLPQLLPYARYYQRSNYNVGGVMAQWYAMYEHDGQVTLQNTIGSAVMSGIAGQILPRDGKDVEKVLHRPHR